ncbi:hypothetical protein HWV62_28763 [Athelia sp. TMB]|nr:hypothetical protein HWV62_28763 [Athelia sp. TMB]
MDLTASLASRESLGSPIKMDHFDLALPVRRADHFARKAPQLPAAVFPQHKERDAWRSPPSTHPRSARTKSEWQAPHSPPVSPPPTAHYRAAPSVPSLRLDLPFNHPPSALAVSDFPSADRVYFHHTPASPPRGRAYDIVNGNGSISSDASSQARTASSFESASAEVPQPEAKKARRISRFFEPLAKRMSLGLGIGAKPTAHKIELPTFTRAPVVEEEPAPRPPRRTSPRPPPRTRVPEDVSPAPAAPPPPAHVPFPRRPPPLTLSTAPSAFPPAPLTALPSRRRPLSAASPMRRPHSSAGPSQPRPFLAHPPAPAPKPRAPKRPSTAPGALIETPHTIEEHRPPSRAALADAAALPVLDARGARVRFGDLWLGQKTVVVFIRHFWCPLCQDYLFSLTRLGSGAALKQAGVRLVVVGNGAYGMIKAYRKIFGMQFALYTDPTLQVYHALGMTLRTLDGGPEAQRGAYVRHGLVGGIAMVVVNAVKVGMPVWKEGGDLEQLGGEFVLGPGCAPFPFPSSLPLSLPLPPSPP